jgi:alginate O-acetyltransferase complex protein AlgI
VEADKIFALHSGDMSTGIAWIGVLAYAFQIYFDFSGYSDMAIGMARMMGFVFPENFNSPYISQSITEFWRRWHMTLSRWMRDYLYIPLGGNRLTTKRMYLNLGLVFVVSGIWHGAAWTFLVWGLFHGGFLILDRLFLLKGLAKIGKFPGMVVTFGITLIGWVLFRSETLPDAGRYICKMFAMDWHHRDVVLDARFWAMMAIATFISFGRTFEIGDRVAKMILANSHSVSRYWVMTTAAAVLFALSIGAVTSSEFNPFIYFRF